MTKEGFTAPNGYAIRGVEQSGGLDVWPIAWGGEYPGEFTYRSDGPGQPEWEELELGGSPIFIDTNGHSWLREHLIPADAKPIDAAYCAHMQQQVRLLKRASALHRVIAEMRHDGTDETFYRAAFLRDLAVIRQRWVEQAEQFGLAGQNQPYRAFPEGYDFPSIDLTDPAVLSADQPHSYETMRDGHRASRPQFIAGETTQDWDKALSSGPGPVTIDHGRLPLRARVDSVRTGATLLRQKMNSGAEHAVMITEIVKLLADLTDIFADFTKERT